MRRIAPALLSRPVLTAAVLCVAATFSAPTASRAGTLAGVTVPDTAEVGGKPLVLNGLGLRKKLFIKVYVAGLYLESKQSDAGAILAADEPRRGTMNFLYDVGSEKICEEGWKAGLADNTPGASAEVKAQFDTLCSYMEDMNDGEAMSFDYVPGSGTTVTVKGKAKGTIPGKPFADGLFGCWLGPKPGPGADFKAALLGKAN
jgi:hypothetical protein